MKAVQILTSTLSLMLTVAMANNLAFASTSALFSYSTDQQLIEDVKLVGRLENGLEVYAWKWKAEAASFDLRYNNSGNDNAFAPIGFIAQHLAIKFPNAVFRGDDGLLLINGEQLSLADEFMNKKLSASIIRVEDGRCARVLESNNLILCF